jgi:3-hydroxyisobutyrate dehydrogenase
MSAGIPGVAWIGIGAMGLPMACRLAQHGVGVRVFDRDAQRLQQAAAQGLVAAASVAQAVHGAQTVFSTVFDDAALCSLVDGPQGLAAAMPPGSLLVEMSTVSPAASARVAERLQAAGVRYLRAPISGSVGLAERGELSVFTSGDEADAVQARALLAHVSRHQQHVGAAEAARVLKLAINLMVVASTSLIGEALAFGERNGLPRAALVDALNASIVGSRHYQSRADSLKTRAYNANGPLRLVAKDLALALQIAREQGLDLPITDHCSAAVERLVQQGHGDVEVTLLAD